MLPLLGWVPLMVSAVLLGTGWITLWTVADGSPKVLGALTLWFLLAAWLQLSPGSPARATVGLTLQVVLAVALLVRLRLRAAGA